MLAQGSCPKRGAWLGVGKETPGSLLKKASWGSGSNTAQRQGSRRKGLPVHVVDPGLGTSPHREEGKALGAGKGLHLWGSSQMPTPTAGLPISSYRLQGGHTLWQALGRENVTQAADPHLGLHFDTCCPEVPKFPFKQKALSTHYVLSSTPFTKGHPESQPLQPPLLCFFVLRMMSGTKGV